MCYLDMNSMGEGSAIASGGAAGYRDGRYLQAEIR